jgi:hypothetical protein
MLIVSVTTFEIPINLATLAIASPLLHLIPASRETSHISCNPYNQFALKSVSEFNIGKIFVSLN